MYVPLKTAVLTRLSGTSTPVRTEFSKARTGRRDVVDSYDTYQPRTKIPLVSLVQCMTVNPGYKILYERHSKCIHTAIPVLETIKVSVDCIPESTGTWCLVVLVPGSQVRYGDDSWTSIASSYRYYRYMFTCRPPLPTLTGARGTIPYPGYR